MKTQVEGVNNTHLPTHPSLCIILIIMVYACMFTGIYVDRMYSVLACMTPMFVLGLLLVCGWPRVPSGPAVWAPHHRPCG